MKLSNNQSFSTPVITNINDYYDTNIEFKIEFNDPNISYSLVCNSEYIDNLFVNDKIAFIVNIEGSNPAFRLTEVLSCMDGLVTIPHQYLKGNIDVTLLIVAKKEFILESNEIVFEGQYSIDKHQIIGYMPTDTIKVALDKTISELITFNVSEKNIIEYNYSDSSIDIYFPKETYQFINLEKNNNSIKSTLFNLYVFPALIAYLNKMKFEEDDSLLFNTFNEILLSKGIEIDDDNFINKIPEYAANILNNTYAAIPNEIKILKDQND